MLSSGILHCVALVRTDVSEEPIASIIRVTRIVELGTTSIFLPSPLRLLVTAKVVTSSLILVTMMIEVLRSSETSALRRATRRNIPADGILLVNITQCSVTFHKMAHEDMSLMLEFRQDLLSSNESGTGSTQPL
jgi:hypothetical protein